MKYMLLIYNNEATDAKKTPEQQQAEMDAYMAFTEEIQKSGAYIAGEALHPVATATTVRVRGGKPLTTDGPFAETKEQLGGFYMVECPNLDEAIKIAAKIPHAAQDSVEIRPVIDFSQVATA